MHIILYNAFLQVYYKDMTKNLSKKYYINKETGHRYSNFQKSCIFENLKVLPFQIHH